MHSALFLDLGGTLLRLHEDEIFVASDGSVDILPNVVSRLSTVEQDVVLVVTNQSGIEKGTLTTRQVRAFIEQLNRATRGLIDDYWACPFVASPFRKPGAEMVTALADKHFVDLRRSVYVGDTPDDHRCALAAGVGQFIWAEAFFGWTRA
jgi:histidinol-phosphate phosphatase family protein